MSALDFPSNPSLNQIYSANGKRWQWNGSSWIRIPDPGTQGIQGTQGTFGIQGTQGTQGTFGVQGTQGTQGTTGSQGTQGIQGLQGTNFSRTEYNYTATNNQTTFSAIYVDGTDIDVYVNGVRLTPAEYTATDGTEVVLVDPAAGGEVIDITTFTSAGPQGIQGSFGTQGTTGIQGTQGTQGVQGETGTQGATGIQGIQGATGTQGTQGVQASQGTTGTQGTTGIQGATGTQGTTGTQGIQGITGPSTTINATNTTTNATFYPVFVAAAGSNQTASVRTTATAFTFNASTGDLTVGGTITANSDGRLKTNIHTIENALEKVLNLRGVEYDRIDTNVHTIGLIAQELETVYPELVIESNGYKSVAYGNLVGLLIEAIKDQQVRIENLENQINK